MKKLTAMLISLLLIFGLMMPAYAEEPAANAGTSTTPESTTPASPAEATPNEEESTYQGVTQEQLFLRTAFLLQMRKATPVEEDLTQIYKTVSGLKSDVKEVSLSTSQSFSIFFYSLENGAMLVTPDSGSTVKISWTFEVKEGQQLRIFWNPETGVWSLGVDARVQTVNIK